MSWAYQVLINVFLSWVITMGQLVFLDDPYWPTIIPYVCTYMTLTGLLRLLQARGIKGELEECRELLDCSPKWSYGIMHYRLMLKNVNFRHKNLGMKEDGRKV
jgi:hypothetical protein